MNINITKELLSEYFSYSLNNSSETYHGIRIGNSKYVECIIQISELEFGSIIVVNKEQIQERSSSNEERDFLLDYYSKLGLTSISIADDFLRINDFAAAIRLAAELNCFITIEGINSDEFSIAEFSYKKGSNKLVIVAREILPFGEVEDEWSAINMDANFSTVTFFDTYAQNLFKYIYGVSPEGIIAVK